MTKKKGGKNKKIKNCAIKVPTNVPITINANDDSASDCPVFCFKYFDKSCLDKCSEKQTKDFVQRLQCLGKLGWKEICKSGRHEYGFETLPSNQIKTKLPAFVTPDAKVYSFRYNNDNYPFIAVRLDNVIRVLAIEANFGDVYNHKPTNN